MFSIFKRKPRVEEASSTVALSLLELCEDGYCAVVGESHYQEALRATSRICSAGPEGRPAFAGLLVPEPDNPYDENAIAVYSANGRLGYLSRDNALEYGDVFAEITRRGYQGGACTAYLTGGEPDKPSFGVVLRLADPYSCLAELFADEEDWTDGDNAPVTSGVGYVRGRHFTEYVDEVRALRRTGREDEAETLLLELVDATEEESGCEGWGVAPWYYEQLAISYRKRGDVHGEIQILERFARQKHAPGASSPKLLQRLEKARELDHHA